MWRPANHHQSVERTLQQQALFKSAGGRIFFFPPIGHRKHPAVAFSWMYDRIVERRYDELLGPSSQILLMLDIRRKRHARATNGLGAAVGIWNFSEVAAMMLMSVLSRPCRGQARSDIHQPSRVARGSAFSSESATGAFSNNGNSEDEGGTSV